MRLLCTHSSRARPCWTRVAGRRAIAYTSKTPGKTQQYNYFCLNDGGSNGQWRPRRSRGSRSFARRFSEGSSDDRGGGAAGDEAEDDEDSQTRGICGDNGGPTGTFHLVDMPGLGYAKVPGAARRRWLDFLGVYAAQRPQLRLLVHLIDGQVGPMETDLALMRMVKAAYAGQVATRARKGGGEGSEDNDDDLADEAGEEEAGEDEAGEDELESEKLSPELIAQLSEGRSAGGWEYAICLTKADKGGPKAIKKVTAAVRKAIEEVGCPEPVQIVPTSSRSKGGRAAMWRLMRRVVTEHREEL